MSTQIVTQTTHIHTPACECELSPNEWDQFATAYLDDHPEIRAGVPGWADKLELLECADGHAVFTFSRQVGQIELWSMGTLSDGSVELESDGVPGIFLPERGEFAPTTTNEAVNIVLTLAGDLQNAADILNNSGRTLRRNPEATAELMERDQ